MHTVVGKKGGATDLNSLDSFEDVPRDKVEMRLDVI
jgi:hypothetical protein